MEESTLSLAIAGAVISIVAYTMYRIDVWGKRNGLLKDDK